MSYRIAEHLRATDELCKRWVKLAWDWPIWGASPIYRGIQQRAGHIAQACTAPMPEDVEILARIIARSHATVFAFLEIWYARGGSSEQKAKRLGISRRSIYNHHNATLEYLKERLLARNVKV